MELNNRTPPNGRRGSSASDSHSISVLGWASTTPGRNRASTSAVDAGSALASTAMGQPCSRDIASAVISRECTKETWMATRLAAPQQRAQRRDLRPVARLKGAPGVDGQLGDAGGAGGVGDQRGAIDRHGASRHAATAREVGQSGGTGMAAGGEQHRAGVVEDVTGQPLEGVLVGEEEGPAHAADQLRGDLGGEVRRQQDRYGARARDREGEQGDVEAVGLVQHHPVAHADAGGAEP